jgi:hypothetical protein
MFSFFIQIQEKSLVQKRDKTVPMQLFIGGSTHADEYKTIIETARNESNLSTLHFVLAPSITDYQNHIGIVDATIKVIVEEKNLSIGSNIYLYDDSLRLEDRLYLNEKGEQKAAEYFASYLGDTYLSKSQPCVINTGLNEPPISSSIKEAAPIKKKDNSTNTSLPCCFFL